VTISAIAPASGHDILFAMWNGWLSCIDIYLLTSLKYTFLRIAKLRSQWPCGLRRGFAAARLLIDGSNPAGAWMSVLSVVCCQVEVSGTGWSLVQRSPTDCVCVCARACVCH
jgi:hypothetical protein